MVDDRAAETIDIVPTIADALDVELPWEVDGELLLAGEGARERPARLFDWEFRSLRPDEATSPPSIAMRVSPRSRRAPGWGRAMSRIRSIASASTAPLVGVPVEELEVGAADEGTVSRSPSRPQLPMTQHPEAPPVYLWERWRGSETTGSLWP